MIALSLDIDWAPQEVLGDALGLLARYGLKCTLFATHECRLPNGEGFEVGLHPNIASLDEAEGKIAALKGCYPQARGIRNHGLFSSFYLYETYRKLGINYESNHLCQSQEGLRCFHMPGGIAQAPICFMDDVHLRFLGGQEVGREIPFRGGWLEDESVKVFAFHPVHLFLNTRSLAHYQEAKPHYQDALRLQDFQHSGPGIRGLFTGLAEFIRDHGIKTYTLSELCELSLPQRSADAQESAA